MEAAKEVYRLAPLLPRENVRDALPRKITRAAVSIPANIARGLGEGVERGEAQFLAIAQGSRSRGGDVSDALRGDRLVSEYRDELPANARRSGKDL